MVAVDVGYGQLAWSLQSDDRVQVHDRTNIRELTLDLVRDYLDALSKETMELLQQFERLDEAIYFHTLLQQNKMKVAAIVVNRVHAPVPDALWGEVARLPPSAQAKFDQTLKENDHLARQDARGIAKLREASGATPLVLVPRFDLDVHDLKGLYETSHWLWGDRHLEVAAPGR